MCEFRLDQALAKLPFSFGTTGWDVALKVEYTTLGQSLQGSVYDGGTESGLTPSDLPVRFSLQYTIYSRNS